MRLILGNVNSFNYVCKISFSLIILIGENEKMNRKIHVWFGKGLWLRVERNGIGVKWGSRTVLSEFENQQLLGAHVAHAGLIVLLEFHLKPELPTFPLSLRNVCSDNGKVYPSDLSCGPRYPLNLL
uniref:Uncharacterized protein n=1 Tax=Solanum lycopersicum TaxID=4081 RepID=K4BRC4_SOLLC